MFCRKCGTELGEGAKFCKKCGTEVTIRPQSEVTIRPQSEIALDVEKKNGDEEVPATDSLTKGKNTKLIIILCVCVVLAIASALAYVFIVVKPFDHKNVRIEDENDKDDEDDDDEEDSDSDNEDADEADVEAETETAEPAEEAEAAPAIRQLSEIDEQAIKELFDVATNNIFYRAEVYENRISKKYDLRHDSEYRCVLSVADAKDFMTNTLGYEDVDSIADAKADEWNYVEKQSDGIHFCVPDTGDCNFSYEVTGIEMSEEGNLTVYGYQMEKHWSEETSVYYRLFMVPNEKSIWDGFTVDSVEQMNTQHYYLPDVQERVYDVDELDFTEEEYRRARNEIFARHGRLFKSEELQEYFNSQSWYYGMREEVPESELNTYEIQNIKVLDDYKKKMKY